MAKSKILLIEDEEDIADLISLQAELSDYKIVVEFDGLNGLLAVEREHPDLVILDIMLPGLNGLDICRKIKSNPKTKDIPVIMISAKGEELDVVLGLELGADDYVSKPFSVKVLFSRIRAVLRRGKDVEKGPKMIFFGHFTMDLDNYLLQKKGKVVSLTLTEFQILSSLLQHRNKVLSRSQILDDMPNNDLCIVDRNIDVHIAALRRKLGPNFQNIETVRGVGYRFVDDD
ncbi:MAG: response regulator transcription factor [Parachlamydiaceae bacterium]|nr:response regulator transcription factor [Parachlamydiaceae bacterium]